MGVLNVAITRDIGTAFCIEVYKQHINDAGYETTPDYRIDGPGFTDQKTGDIVLNPETEGQEEYAKALTGVCGEIINAYDEGNLKDIYNPKT